MLAFVAAALFVIVSSIRIIETSTEVIFSPTYLMLTGLASASRIAHQWS
ncbi:MULTISPECIES: hypothetical protein [unclassified Streptomyces]